MVDPRMAQATAVHTKIAMIAAIRLIMVFCASTLSAVRPTYRSELALSSTFHCKVTRSRVPNPGLSVSHSNAVRVHCGETLEAAEVCHVHGEYVVDGVHVHCRR